MYLWTCDNKKCSQYREYKRIVKGYTPGGPSDSGTIKCPECHKPLGVITHSPFFKA